MVYRVQSLRTVFEKMLESGVDMTISIRFGINNVEETVSQIQRNCFWMQPDPETVAYSGEELRERDIFISDSSDSGSVVMWIQNFLH